MSNYKDKKDFKGILDAMNPMGRLGGAGFQDPLKHLQGGPTGPAHVQNQELEEVELTEREQEVFEQIRQDYYDEYMDILFDGTEITDPEERKKALVEMEKYTAKKRVRPRAAVDVTSTGDIYADNARGAEQANGKADNIIPLNKPNLSLLDGEWEAIQKDHEEEEDKIKANQQIKVEFSPEEVQGGKEESYHEKFLDEQEAKKKEEFEQLYKEQVDPSD